MTVEQRIAQLQAEIRAFRVFMGNPANADYFNDAIRGKSRRATGERKIAQREAKIAELQRKGRLEAAEAKRARQRKRNLHSAGLTPRPIGCSLCKEPLSDEDIIWASSDGSLDTDKGNPFCVKCLPAQPEEKVEAPALFTPSFEFED